ncbi:MAG: aldehyde dehydrogenase family protein [Acidobacteria bacterium]|nr:aldehyde dehydrogenase family protein [Acidobacteriota bacterium]
MKMLLNGRWADAVSGEVIPIYNPATLSRIDEVPRAGAADVDIAVRYAGEGYRINRRLPAHCRRGYLARTGELIAEHLEELRDLMIRENGKPHYWADFEIRKSAEIFQTIAERVRDPHGATYPMDAMAGCETQMAMVYRQPIGIVGAIIPFNFPAEMLAYKISSALSMGNSIVAKLSEDCPLTCLRIGELMLEAGVPPEAFHLLVGYGEEAGEALVTHPEVPAISFTGSSAVGKRIMEKAAPYLKRLSLELGGNDPVIVFADADLQLVANNLVRGRMTVGNGQACVADKRFLVERPAVAQFLELATEVVDRLKMGDPTDPAVDVGPLIHEDAARRVESQIQDAIETGARVLTGGKRVNRTFIMPTVLADVTCSMRVMREECFGPVAPVMAFDGEEEALSVANNSCYGLQGAVYTRDISRALRVADEMEVGGVVINGSSCFRPGNVPYIPRKESGLGRDNMFDGVEELSTGKAVVISNARR